MPGKLGLSETEYLIMSYFWEMDCQMTLGDIIKHFAKLGHTWASQTVKTFLTNLIKKGALAVKRQGHQYLYYPAMNRSAYSAYWLKSLIHQNFSNGMDDFIVTLVNLKTELSEEQKKNWRRFGMNDFMRLLFYMSFMGSVPLLFYYVIRWKEKEQISAAASYSLLLLSALFFLVPFPLLSLRLRIAALTVYHFPVGGCSPWSSYQQILNQKKPTFLHSASRTGPR